MLNFAFKPFIYEQKIICQYGQNYVFRFAVVYKYTILRHMQNKIDMPELF